MIILAIDTSLGPCSAAIYKDGNILAEDQNREPGQQSRVLVPMLESLLAQTKLRYSDCDAIASTIGPGGFTGIRTGLATARTIALALDKPLIGLTTLEVIAHASGISGDVLAVIDAYREQWYVQRFRMNGAAAAQSDPLLLDAKGLKALSHGAKIVETAPTARGLAALAYEKWMRGERIFTNSPLYIREPDAKLPLKENLLS